MVMESLKRKDVWKVYEQETPSRTHNFSGRSMGILDSLQSHQLTLLMDSFFKPRPVKSELYRRVRRCDQVSGNSMSFDEFFLALKEASGREFQRRDVEEFFNEMGVSCEERVEWQMFHSFMKHQFMHAMESLENRKALHISHPIIRKCTYNKQEPIVRVLALTRSPPLRYVSVSKRGSLIVWSRDLNNVKPLETCADPYGRREWRQRFRGWVTDAIYMANVHKIAVATLNRGIHFFDVGAKTGFEPSCHLYGLSHFAASLCYWYDTKAPEGKCVLLWGDEKGSVHLLWFLQPFKGLFETPFSHQTGPVQISLPGLSGRSALASHQTISRVHSGTINRILYEPGDDIIITSSESPASSVVILAVDQKSDRYVWRVEKGVKCLAFSVSLGLLVTAGSGPSLRLWNRYVTTRPSAILRAHQSLQNSVLDVAIHQPLGKIFSYCSDAVLNIWDIASHQCIQTVHLKFPNIQAGVSPEQGSVPLLLSLSSETVLVTCREYLAMMHLDVPECRQRPQVFTYALYSSVLQRVITASADSTLTVWEVKTGIKKIEIRNAHGEEEISCLAGLNLHKLEPVSDAEVTGIICLHGDQVLVTGWSRKITQYSIACSNETFIKAGRLWNAGRQHREDVLAVDHCPALGVLATGSFDGEIISNAVSVLTPVFLCVFRAGLPVHRLLFLHRRAQQRSGVMLLSSQAGSPVADCPPLLLSWSAHQGAIVSSEILLVESRLFLFSVSVDRRASFWTHKGEFVGCLGQEHLWDLSKPETYQKNRAITEESDERSNRSQSRPTARSVKVCWGESSEGGRGQTDQEKKTSVWPYMRRGGGREKLCRFGKEFTPFLALELPEMTELERVPLKPWRLKMLRESSSTDQLQCQSLDE
ncbi:hypothetical protein DNTS_028838 [Danionella cerebrum]|uniref:Uncharacterized protein n=1 Tax=Danionella cerebrum TaxID=2873325 RepID=A0A553QFA4_9TELE|nr:hypothetical protein DNTS_028838 [Danionella translucida]